MKYFDWNQDKDLKLKEERGISFNDVVSVLESEGPLDIIKNPNKDKYPNQKMYVVEIDEYVYLVPFAEDEEKCFLKTIFPSRKMTKKYLKNNK